MGGTVRPILAMQPEQVAAAARREHGGERADDRRGVGDRIAREQHAAERVGAQALPHRLLVHRPVDADHPADAQQREAEHERDRREVLGRDEDEHRVAGAPVGQPRGDQARTPSG